MNLNCFVCSQKGNFRENNEDNLYINGKYLQINHDDVCFSEKIKNADNVLIGVFDGLGGEQDGETASYKAAAALDKYTDGIDFDEYFDLSNKELCSLSKQKNKTVGSTAAVIHIQNDEFTAANMGDSRIYHIRSGAISRISLDHTIIETMINSGVLKREDAAKSMYKNYLTRCLGMYSGSEDLAHITEKAELKKGDIFVICSDGLSGVMEDEEILQCLSRCKSGENSALQLTKTAYEKGSRDNTTVIVIYCTGETGGLFGLLKKK